MMKDLKIVFENISGGFVMAGRTYGEMLFSRVSLKEYIKYFQKYEPDILSLSEIHLDDAEGNSQMVQRISKELMLPYYVCFSQSESHLDTSKYLGTAILSRYSIVDWETFLLPNPKLEVDRADGAHWIMSDKGVLKTKLDINGRLINVLNLHYFPFHHFGHKMNEDEFAPIRQALVDIFRAEDDIPIIITGDFNNKGLPLHKAFPELFASSIFREAIVVETTVIGLHDQLDHILYPPKMLVVNCAYTERNLSDHYAIIADFSFQRRKLQI